jgi:hypothetical protein
MPVEDRERVQHAEHLRQQAVLVGDGLGPRRHREDAVHAHRRRPLGRAAVLAPAVGTAPARLLGLAQVAEKEVHGRARELAGPLAARRLEDDVDVVEAVTPQLRDEQVAQADVEVGDHRVDRHVDRRGHRR